MTITTDMLVAHGFGTEHDYDIRGTDLGVTWVYDEDHPGTTHVFVGPNDGHTDMWECTYLYHLDERIHDRHEALWMLNQYVDHHGVPATASC